MFSYKRSCGTGGFGHNGASLSPVAHTAFRLPESSAPVPGRYGKHLTTKLLCLPLPCLPTAGAVARPRGGRAARCGDNSRSRDGTAIITTAGRFCNRPAVSTRTGVSEIVQLHRAGMLPGTARACADGTTPKIVYCTAMTGRPGDAHATTSVRHTDCLCHSTKMLCVSPSIDCCFG